MRKLKFIVDGQSLKKKTGCNFAGIVPGTSGYLCTTFEFSEDWNGTVRVAEFRKTLHTAPVSVPIINNECMVPSDVTSGDRWYIKVIGKIGNVIIPTETCRVRQEV